MYVHGPRVRMMPEPIQSAQALCERANPARLRDEVLRVDVRADLEGLRRNHDEVPFAENSRRACRSHAGGAIQDACPALLGLPLAVEAGQQQRIGCGIR